MKKGKHTEEQTIGVLKRPDAGQTVKDRCGSGSATIYTWKSK